MSNPTELPDLYLDELETLCKNAPAMWYGTLQIADGVTDDNAALLIEACSPDTVAELVRLARRAQPEGEAPQAEPVAWMLDFGDGRVVTADRKEMEAWVTQHDNPYTPIPLGPITAPAAQHAESGAPEANAASNPYAAPSWDHEYSPDDDADDEVAAQSQGAQPSRAECKAEPGTWSECQMRTIELYTALQGPKFSAQQAAAPGALTLLNADELAALHRFQETCQDFDSGGYDVDKNMMKRLASIGVIESKGFNRYQFTEFGDYVVENQAASAPGTPEAPKGGA